MPKFLPSQKRLRKKQSTWNIGRILKLILIFGTLILGGFLGLNALKPFESKNEKKDFDLYSNPNLPDSNLNLTPLNLPPIPELDLPALQNELKTTSKNKELTFLRGAKRIKRRITTNSLLAYYPFNNNAKDATGHGYDGTVRGAMPTRDRFDGSSKAYAFSGKEDIDLGNHPALKLTRSFTLSAWVKNTDNDEGEHFILYWHNGGTQTGWFLEKHENNFKFYLGNTEKFIRLSSNFKINDGRWHYLAGTNDENTQIIYVDGVQKNSAKAIQSTSPTDAQNLLAGLIFTGVIDELRIYNYPLSPEEIMSLYLSTSDSMPSSVYAPSSPTLDIAAYYPLNHNAYDHGPHKRHAIVQQALLSSGPFKQPNTAYFFDGSKGYLAVQNSAIFDFGPKDFTISLWLSFADINRAHNGLLGKEDFQWIALEYNHDGQRKLSLWADQDCNNRAWSFAAQAAGIKADWQKNTWYQITIVKKDNVLRVYVNAQKDIDLPYSMSICNPSTETYFGRSQQPERLHHGKLSDIRVYSKGLSTTEVNTLYANTKFLWINNKLAIQKDKSVVITTENFNALPLSNQNTTLSFLIRHILHGLFETINNPKTPIYKLTQQDITNRQIKFVHNGNDKPPVFETAITDGYWTSDFVPTTIHFQNPSPSQINNQPPTFDKHTITVRSASTNNRITITSEMLSAFDHNNNNASLQFYVNNIKHGHFELNPNLGTAIVNFFQNQIWNQSILFKINDIESNLACNMTVSNGIAHSPETPIQFIIHRDETNLTWLWLILSLAALGGTSWAVYQHLQRKNITYYSASDINMGDQIGTGSFGKVFFGNFKNKTDQLAIKQVKKQRHTNTKTFINEAELWLKLSDSKKRQQPHIVKLFGVCKERQYFIMEYMQNGSLRKTLQEETPLTIEQRLAIALEITNGLLRIHGKRIIHRDIKSPNILLGENFNVKLADFSLARRLPKTKDFILTQKVEGSYQWLAPEIFAEKKYSRKSDIYAFGVILFELLTGQLPFKSQHNEEIKSNLLRIANTNTCAIPLSKVKNTSLWPQRQFTQLRQLLEQCCQSQPENRPTLRAINNKLKTLYSSIRTISPPKKESTANPYSTAGNTMETWQTSTSTAATTFFAKGMQNPFVPMNQACAAPSIELLDQHH